MAVFLLLALFGVLEVLGQATHNTVTFSYQACSNVDVSRFGAPLVFPDGRVTPEACQASCQGHRYAALMPNACRCGDDPDAVHGIDESKCDFACMGDRSLGMCGSVCPENSPKIANIYTRAIAAPAASSPAIGGISQYQSSPVSSASTCSSAGAANGQPTMTTAVPPPTVKTPDASLPPMPSPLGPQSSSCTSAANPNLGAPASAPVGSSHDLPTHAPESNAYPRPTQPPPATQPSQVPPGPSPQPYTGSQTPSGDAGQLPSGGVHSVPRGATSPSPVVSESTLWPKTSASKSSGILPVPSQVPGSDSSHGPAPPFLGIGGLAVIAAMLI